jgi:hypothetical protein
VNFEFWREHPGYMNDYPRLSAITSLALREIGTFKAMDIAWSWVIHTHDALKKLNLELDEDPMDDDLMDMTPEIAETWTPFKQYIDICRAEDTEFPHQGRLFLHSLALRHLSLEGMDRAVELETITTLSLHNCKDVEVLFVLWASMPESIHLTKLRLSLHRAKDNCSDAVLAAANAFNNFLMCFEGLEELYINSTVHKRPIELKILHKHRKTLEKLAIDHRSRNTGRHRIVKHENMLEIHRLCRKLSELAISIDTSDDVSRF